MTIMSQGAEAIIRRKGNTIVKERVTKSYRHPELDKRLRSDRSLREARVLQRLESNGIRVPSVQESDGATITMDFVDSVEIDAVVGDNPSCLCEVGQIVQDMHDSGVAHGDLTTSNILWDDGPVLIDFGLALFTEKIEDKATDVHVLYQSLIAKHGEKGVKAFDAFRESYEDEAVFERWHEVEKRGRYK